MGYNRQENKADTDVAHRRALVRSELPEGQYFRCSGDIEILIDLDNLFCKIHMPEQS